LPPTSKMRFDPFQKRYPLAAYKYQSLTHIEEFKYVNLRYETLDYKISTGEIPMGARHNGKALSEFS